MTLGPYEILETLAEAGDGTVYRARHRESGRIVAVKRLNRRVLEDGPEIERFRREVEAVIALRSDRIVSISSTHLVDGQPVVEMELLPHGTLLSAMHAAPVPLALALRILEDVLTALKAFHDAGRLHRAVRPSNVHLDGQGGAKLGDARLAIAGDDQSSTVSATSIAYLAPECMSGHGGDARSDLYSAGMAIFEAILGTAGFQSAFPDLMPMEAFAGKWLSLTTDGATTAPPLHSLRPDIPVGISQFVARLIAKDPELRFSTADAALQGLRAVLNPSSASISVGERTLAVLRADPEPQPLTPTRAEPRPVAEHPPAPASSGDTVYFMTLVGGIAGLSCWAVTTSLADYLMLRQEATPVLLTLWTTIMGALIGGMTVGFSDTRGADRVVLRWLVAGTILGTLAGLIAGLLYIPIEISVVAAGSVGIRDLLARSALWTIAGWMIGLATGIRWYSVNPSRTVHAALGGILGGTLGGLVFQYMAQRHEFFAALAFVLVGMGISLGLTLAPVLLRDGVLLFVRSTDERAHARWGREQQWAVQDGDRLLIGSEGAGSATTLYARNIHVFIPDAAMAPRHAILFEREKKFFLQPHPENLGEDGGLDAPLSVGGVEVSELRELHHGDEIRMGGTVLRFLLTKKRPRQDPLAALRAAQR